MTWYYSATYRIYVFGLWVLLHAMEQQFNFQIKLNEWSHFGEKRSNDYFAFHAEMTERKLATIPNFHPSRTNLLEHRCRAAPSALRRISSASFIKVNIYSQFCPAYA